MREVLYTSLVSGKIAVGNRVTVIPMNHTSGHVVNGMPAYTTPIRQVLADGSFYTENSHYVYADLQPKREEPKHRVYVLENPLLF